MTTSILDDATRMAAMSSSGSSSSSSSSSSSYSNDNDSIHGFQTNGCSRVRSEAATRATTPPPPPPTATRPSKQGSAPCPYSFCHSYNANHAPTAPTPSTRPGHQSTVGPSWAGKPSWRPSAAAGSSSLSTGQSSSFPTSSTLSLSSSWSSSPPSYRYTTTSYNANSTTPTKDHPLLSLSPPNIDTNYSGHHTTPIVTSAKLDKRRESVLANASLRVHPFIVMGQTATKFVPPGTTVPATTAQNQDTLRDRQRRDFEHELERQREVERREGQLRRERELPAVPQPPPPPLPTPVADTQEVLIPPLSKVSVTTPTTSSNVVKYTLSDILPSAAPPPQPQPQAPAKVDSSARRGLGLVRKLSFRTRDRAVAAAGGSVPPARQEALPPAPVPLSVSTSSTTAATASPAATPARPPKSAARTPSLSKGDFAHTGTASDDESGAKSRLLSRAASVGHAVARPRPVRARANASPISAAPSYGVLAQPPRLAPVPASVSSVSGSPPCSPPMQAVGSTTGPKERHRKSAQSPPRHRGSITVRREREWRAKLASLTLASPPRTPPPSTRSGPRPPPRRVQRPSDQPASDAGHGVSPIGESSFEALLIKTAPDPMSSSATFKEVSIKESLRSAPSFRTSPTMKEIPLPPVPDMPMSSPATEFGRLTPARSVLEPGGYVSPAVSAVGKYRPPRSVVSMARSTSTSSIIDRASVISGSTFSRGSMIGVMMSEHERPPLPTSSLKHKISASVDTQASRPSVNGPPSPALTLAPSLKAPATVPQLPPSAFPSPVSATGAVSLEAPATPAGASSTSSRTSREKKRVSGTSTVHSSTLTSSTSASHTTMHESGWIPDERVVVSRASVPDIHTISPPAARQLQDAPPTAVRRGTVCEATTVGKGSSRGLSLPFVPVIDEAPATPTYDWPTSAVADEDVIMELPLHMKAPPLQRQGTTASASTTNSTATTASTSASLSTAVTHIGGNRRNPPPPAFYPSRGMPMGPGRNAKMVIDTRVSPLLSDLSPFSPCESDAPAPSIPAVPALPPGGPPPAAGDGHVKRNASTRNTGDRDARPRGREEFVLDGTVRGPPSFDTDAGAGTYSLRGHDLTPGLESGRRPRKTGLPMADLHRWLEQTTST